MIAQFLLGLSIVVGLHELGHLLFAKLFGMRVESYIIGFPPKLFRYQWGETEYAIGAVPLGGAVKIAGMIDESLDTHHLPQAPEPWEFRSKPAWQRLLVMLGGILFNILSGLLIYIVLTFALGDTYLAKDEVNRHGIVPNKVGRSLGFQEGDRIVNINGQDFDKFADVLKPYTLMAAPGYYTVQRDGQELRIDIPADLIERLADEKEFTPLVAPRVPFAVGEVQPNGGAALAGLQPGDHLVAVAGMPTQYFHQLQRALAAYAGQTVALQYLRAGVLHEVQAAVDATGKLGFRPTMLLAYKRQQYSLGKAMGIGTCKAFDIMRVNLIGLGKVLTGQISASKSLSGPIGIAQIFGRRFDWINFWSITGFLSMVLALMNLLPIPALDGGHALFLLYEITTGRRLSDRFLLNAQKVGMAILLLLIGYATINDVYKLF